MINCTVAWEGDVSQLTISWSYNEVNISTSEKYIVTDSHLMIREFTTKDVGLYRCTVQLQSGWSDSRKYFISANQGNEYSANTVKLRVLIVTSTFFVFRFIVSLPSIVTREWTAKVSMFYDALTYSVFLYFFVCTKRMSFQHQNDVSKVNLYCVVYKCLYLGHKTNICLLSMNRQFHGV